ncbi:hypothetical protein GQR58_002202 [Nymphon striatum]|nr:hypothetical protein GQR58_002202 [Nymphon striatum]
MFKVGVVWSGSATYKGNSFRSFTHREFLPMAEIPNVQLFSLYKGPFLEALKKDGSGALIIDTASTDRDFADYALWEELYQINSDLWVIEDDIRDCEMAKDFGEEFIRLARAVYITNDRRADDNRSRSRGPIVRQLHEAQRMLSPLYTYSSQAGQDLVVDRVMQNKRGGTFVDVGGYDGVTGSNTYFLETMRGWTGALVEPVRAQISKAEKWRTCPCLEVAIASQKGSYDKGLLKTVRDDKRHKEKTVKVKTMTLADVLHQMNLVNPDFISLDIEGGELTCLETFPFADHDVAVWAIENNAGTPEIKNIMEAQGYDLIEFCGPDEVYFKRSP